MHHLPTGAGFRNHPQYDRIMEGNIWSKNMMRYHHDFGNLWKEENVENTLLNIEKKKRVQSHGLVYHLFPHVLMTRYNLHGETSKVLITFQISSFFCEFPSSVVFNQHFNYLSIFGPQGPPQEPRCHVGCTYWISP